MADPIRETIRSCFQRRRSPFMSTVAAAMLRAYVDRYGEDPRYDAGPAQYDDGWDPDPETVRMMTGRIGALDRRG